MPLNFWNYQASKLYITPGYMLWNSLLSPTKLMVATSGNQENQWWIFELLRLYSHLKICLKLQIPQLIYQLNEWLVGTTSLRTTYMLLYNNYVCHTLPCSFMLHTCLINAPLHVSYVLLCVPFPSYLPHMLLCACYLYLHTPTCSLSNLMHLCMSLCTLCIPTSLYAHPSCPYTPLYMPHVLPMCPHVPQSVPLCPMCSIDTLICLLDTTMHTYVFQLGL